MHNTHIRAFLHWSRPPPPPGGGGGVLAFTDRVSVVIIAFGGGHWILKYPGVLKVDTEWIFQHTRAEFDLKEESFFSILPFWHKVNGCTTLHNPGSCLDIFFNKNNQNLGAWYGETVDSEFGVVSKFKPFPGQLCMVNRRRRHV